MLEAQGLTLASTQALPDHYDFSSYKALHDKDLTVICTEKDAVKLWKTHPDALAVPLRADMDPRFFAALEGLLAHAKARSLSSPS